MVLESDLLLERQKIRRKLLFWRSLAIVICALSIIVGSAKIMTGKLKPHETHLVKLSIEGVISSDVSKQVKVIDTALNDESVKGMLLYVNSPGGAVSGGEQLHDALVRFSQKKPIAVTMGGVAASAGYMISVPAKRIFAFNSTLTGSIGVIMQSPDFSGLLNKVGVSVDQLVSGPLKGQPSMVKPLSPAGQKMLQDLIGNFYNQFVTMVAEGRHMEVARVKALGDGRPYSGQQALQVGLIDQIGNEQDAKNWMIKTYHLPKNIKVAELRPEDDQFWFSRYTKSVLDLSLQGLLQQVLVGKENAGFDGVLAIWQP